MATQAVAVTVVVSMVVAMAVAIMRMAAGFLCFVMHQHDSNRDLVWLTAWIRGGSMVNNGVDRSDRRERTRRPKRN
jgi:hypothetical protein